MCLLGLARCAPHTCPLVHHHHHHTGSYTFDGGISVVSRSYSPTCTRSSLLSLSPLPIHGDLLAPEILSFLIFMRLAALLRVSSISSTPPRVYTQYTCHFLIETSGDIVLFSFSAPLIFTTPNTFENSNHSNILVFFFTLLWDTGFKGSRVK